MKKQDEQIDALFNAGLSNYEETPSSSAWKSIEGQLSAQSHNRTYWVAASIVAVLLTSTVIWNNVINKTSSFRYEMADTAVKANFPQKEFIPTPILVHSTTIVYIQSAPVLQELTETIEDKAPLEAVAVNSVSNFNIKPLSNRQELTTNISNTALNKPELTTLEPITIIYKKGEPKHPKLAKAASYLKQVGEGERPLIDFEKISTGFIARRETNNNSNN